MVHTQALKEYQFIEPELPFGLEHYWFATPVNYLHPEFLGADLEHPVSNLDVEALCQVLSSIDVTGLVDKACTANSARNTVYICH